MNGKEVIKKPVSKETAKDGWLEVTVDLAAEAGRTVELELINQPSGWSWEAAYWATITIESEA